MKAGIVAEGPADVAVLRNILKGRLGLDRKDVLAIRPELFLDETDLQAQGFRPQAEAAFSNWLLVLEECRARTKIAEFVSLPIEGERFVVVHIDTAEAHEKGYDIARPDRKAPDYADALRALVTAKLDGLLGPDLAQRVRYAIAVEETDAWLLAIHEPGKRDTFAYLNAKKKLEYVLKRPKGMKWQDYEVLSRDFRDPKKLEAHAKRNRSLRIFLDSLP